MADYCVSLASELGAMTWLLITKLLTHKPKRWLCTEMTVQAINFVAAQFAQYLCVYQYSGDIFPIAFQLITVSFGVPCSEAVRQSYSQFETKPRYSTRNGFFATGAKHIELAITLELRVLARKPMS